ncbi:MAG: hypothetical protein MUO76_03710 [Anaerolineaceae bacterium]|nr:hypothetical protein [Anaerolineaceae bacterium]
MKIGSQKGNCSLFLLITTLVLPILYACSPTGSITDLPLDGTYPVDPILEDFYLDLGGADILGAAISALFTRDGFQCQYTVNALMCSDPLVTGIARYHLEPLGEQLGVFETPDPQVEIKYPIIVDGYGIYKEFIPLYNILDGPLYTGSPLSNPIYNHNMQRIEQYFQNVGFFLPLNNSPDANLLEYGAYLCDQDCRYPNNNFVPQIEDPSANSESRFEFSIANLGGFEVFGESLTELYISADGSLEKVYETVVFFAPQDDPGYVRLRPLPIMLGFEIMEPGPKKYRIEDNMIFYAFEGNLGYHVPIVFDEFISSHGGTGISGNPIWDPATYAGGDGPRQCFENYCLDYYKEAASGKNARLAALGALYLEQIDPSLVLSQEDTGLDYGLPSLTNEYANEDLDFVMNESKPQITNQDTQTIEIMVFRNETYQPISGIRASVTLTVPDGSRFIYHLPPTDAEGKSNITIDPFYMVTCNNLITYEVCLSLFGNTNQCASDAFIIWD